jgi:membrane carboxypeptidase/penicillin-binding protein
MQPQFDVLGDGWRQPGSSFKPLIYLVGVDDQTMTAATMFMDVVTNFAPAGAKAYTPTQADGLERGPVRLRNALQFSLNVPAVKAGFINGLQHQFDRIQDFGVRFQGGSAAVPSMSIGTLGVHAIDMISAYGMIANGGVMMPRHTIIQVLDDSGNQVWPPADLKIQGERVVSRQAAYIITDVLAGNTQSSVNPFWARWKVTDGVTGSKSRPAAYKTGTTQDNKDVLAFGFLAPPSKDKDPGLVAGVWMGNSDNSPNDGKLSLDTSAPLWSAILSDVSKGMKIDGFARTRPKGLVTARVDAFTGMKPSGGKTVEEIFIPGTEPTKTASFRRAVDVDAATGLLWRDGCVGPMVTKSFVDYSRAESGFKAWQRADAGWQARAARGPGVSGGPERTRTAYFYGSDGRVAWYPYGRSWGGAFAPSKKCPIAPPEPTPCVSLDPANPCPTEPPEPTPLPSVPTVPGATVADRPTWTPTPRP